MTGRGGAEGYLFTAVRVIPAEGRVEARGKFVRRKEGKVGEIVAKETVERSEEVDMEEGSPPKKLKLDIQAEAGKERELVSNLGVDAEGKDTQRAES